MEILAILVVALNSALVFSKLCLIADQCSCDFDDGSGKVDLTSLGNTDNAPRFKDVLYSPDSTYYSYNPCGGFVEGSGCSYAAACQINSDKTQQLQIGNANASSTSFMYDDPSGNVKVSYTAGSGVLHLTEVVLVCDPTACDPVFTPQGQPATFQFIMQMTTICACPGKCTASGAQECAKGENGSLGAGSIFLILCHAKLAVGLVLTFKLIDYQARHTYQGSSRSYLKSSEYLTMCHLSNSAKLEIRLFSLIFLYLIVGSLFMKFVRKAEGKDIIPNSAFWFSVPGHIKGGVMFVMSKITGRQTATYEST